MSDYSAYVTRMGSYFHLKDAPSYISRMGEASVQVTRLRSDEPRLGVTDVIPAEDSYIIGVQMRKSSTCAMWLDGRFIPPQRFEKNSVCFVHLERDTRVDVQTSFDMIHFCIPRLSLGEIARDFGARSIGALRCPALVTIDPVITRLAGCLLPLLAKTEDICAPFVDHILLALQAHVASKYGEMKIPLRSGTESLAPWQVHRAKEFMASRISGSVSLAELAQQCQLSVSHFARAFKGSVGIAPHHWLVEQKMERAKQLLKSTSLTITAIALECGFSHRPFFSNAFQRTIGINPGEWRRARQTSRRIV
jgi:AraC family transcriptional regulator